MFNFFEFRQSTNTLEINSTGKLPTVKTPTMANPRPQQHDQDTMDIDQASVRNPKGSNRQPTTTYFEQEIVVKFSYRPKDEESQKKVSNTHQAILRQIVSIFPK